MLGIKNTIIAVLITLALAYVYSNWQFQRGIELGKASQIALQVEVDTKAKEAKEELKLAVVEGLKQIQVKNVTINNKAIKEVVKEPVYSECKLTSDGVSIVTQTNRPRN